MNLIEGKTYNENEIMSLLKFHNPTASDTHLKWLLYEILKNSNAVRIGKQKYRINGKKYSNDFRLSITNSIASFLLSNFPLIKNVVWEINQLNEWLNLLFAKNIIFVEIESNYVDLIFQDLLDKFGDDNMLLLNPTVDEIIRYMRDGLIVVKTLYSKSPINKNNNHIKLEKLMVDVVADEILKAFLDTVAIEDIMKGIINNYDFNIEKMYACAKRRRCLDKILKIIEDKNNVR